MSEPLKKLTEVMQEIANDENIEISIIDDVKELVQFIGTTGQSLLAFSNAKKCATFLQANKVILAKTRSKVILLTPKEIPEKTLSKFIKIGLTESILDNSPPKTLVYKVKLLLRSIKTTSRQDAKSADLKSMLDSPSEEVATSSDYNRIGSDADMALNEELEKTKKQSNYSTIPQEKNLKGKNTDQEESIDTNWKGNRKKDDINIEMESDDQRIEDETTLEFDSYLRGKKQSKNFELQIEDEDSKKIKLYAEEDTESSKKKKSPEMVLDIVAPEPGERNQYQEEEKDLISKKKKELQLIIEDEEPTPQIEMTEEDKKEKLRKELEELDLLFAEAKKRQSLEEVEDIGENLKLKRLDLEEVENEEMTELNEERQEEFLKKGKKEKTIELDLLSPEEELKKRLDEEKEKDDLHEGIVDEIDENMFGESASNEKIETLMKGQFNNNTLKLDETDQESDEEKQETLEEKKNKPIKLFNLIENEEDIALDTNNDFADEDPESGKVVHLNLELIKADQDEEELKNDNFPEDNTHKDKLLDIQLEDAAKEDERPNLLEESQQLSYKKSNNLDLDLEHDKEKSHNGKAEKIDSFFRNGEGKKIEHSWDNLNKKSALNLEIEKVSTKDENTLNFEKKDYGEMTIDYRKLRQEFEEMSRDQKTIDENEIGYVSSQNLSDSEDEGTFKVVELNACGFDFGINIINLLYQKDSKPLDFYKLVAEELILKYKGYSLFYSYKASDKKHTEEFDSFLYFNDNFITEELKEWSRNIKSQEEMMANYFSKTMTTWLCREIEDKSGVPGKCWEDVELPKWAANELTTKKVELIFPYFDGVDRMGMAILFFPEGLSIEIEKGLTVTLEMIRTIFLDSIQRTNSQANQRNDEIIEEPLKKNILNMFTSFFNRNKAG